jgi:hypothetical protein
MTIVHGTVTGDSEERKVNKSFLVMHMLPKLLQKAAGTEPVQRKAAEAMSAMLAEPVR